MWPFRRKVQSGSEGDWLEETILDALGQHGVDPESPEGEKLIGDLLSHTLEHGAPGFLRQLKRSASGSLRWEKRYRRRFERRLRRTWKNGLEGLEVLIHISHEAGDSVARRSPSGEPDPTLYALVRIHAKSCQVAREILCLLRSGYAAGAHSRWRTLHEFAVVAAFLREHGPETAERYLLHTNIDSYRGMKQYVEHYEALQHDPVNEDEIERIRSTYNALCERFGKEFSSDYGWAAAALGMKRPNFTDIEKAAGLDQWRPYYRLASSATHAGPKGVLFNIGVPNAAFPALPTGASNAGLADPGHGCAISLTQITTALLCHAPKSQGVLLASALALLVDEIGEDLIAAHDEVERRSAEIAAKHSDRTLRQARHDGSDA